ncbi:MULTISPECIES: hypothetical protein [Thalassospira]|jgi:hypothetical protein|uniref:Holin-X, holin superfamily III n=1 Tax=Thalassospira xiamenensis TaxID=220697 RepID=A0ABR5XXY5_9PROT|nr:MULTISPECIES: hypothetical protein [Thalassospira]MAL28416.1 hypothetical protein [Thalassospira sp.]MBR9781501.1 hypothetical protein [Rhodospirillales bacterium]KZD00554.1 hypothetical protein AUP40_21450 [Thalassospira xiamenensis]KZD11600.1 hypothetical protein AUP45_00230 [Thalassospira xiamenensis]MBL4842585.1 hypothetical protein [Thalassospira sp.]|tara:strand:- start:66606 stop:67124 length:519 start_codon:yes stop_codon:yes gene_type:complete
MIDQLVEAITEIAKAAAVKLAVFAVIGVTILIGIGFLLAAVFIYLAAQFGTLGAALGLGTVLVALGLVALAIVLQRDTSDGIAREDKAGAKPARDEDAVLFDMLIHAARAGYATGQGDKRHMQDGLERLFADLSALGVFDRPVGATTSPAAQPGTPDQPENSSTTSESKMAG